MPLSHLFCQLVGLLIVALRVVPLNQESKHVTDSNRTLDIRLLQQLVTDLDHFVRVRHCQLAPGNERFHILDPSLKVLGLVRRLNILGLLAELEALLEGSESFLVVAVLVNLNLRAGLEEGGQREERLGLGVKVLDGFHDLGVVVPVQSLQVIRRHDKDVGLLQNTGKENDLLCVARPQQRLHRLHFHPCLRELLRGKVEGALLLRHLGDLVQDPVPVGFALLLGRQSFGDAFSGVFIHLNVVL
mmetsp:Transcript_17764/g.41777  ORF Transcript_17764/g.41777 Transcript_17764/m.41777 type:complete len:244 (-) Transcript_17764:3384-4115(-)